MCLILKLKRDEIQFNKEFSAVNASAKKKNNISLAVEKNQIHTQPKKKCKRQLTTTTTKNK